MHKEAIKHCKDKAICNDLRIDVSYNNLQAHISFSVHRDDIEMSGSFDLHKSELSSENWMEEKASNLFGDEYSFSLTATLKNIKSVVLLERRNYSDDLSLTKQNARVIWNLCNRWSKKDISTADQYLTRILMAVPSEANNEADRMGVKLTTDDTYSIDDTISLAEPEMAINSKREFFLQTIAPKALSKIEL